MSDMMTLSATKRDRAGKGSARAARREGLIPAVIYGDRKDPLSITLDANTFRKLINSPGIFSQMLNVQVEGEDNSVLTRDIQFHPVTDVPLHVDFLRIAKGAKIAVMVAVEFINEEKAPGLKTGGILNVVRHEVELSCPATAIPESIVIDLDGANVGDSIHISAVTLPEGVEPTITDRDFTVATIAAPATESDDSDAAAEGDAETEAEGE
ncbi:MAG: 50S ribosomal protein L25/general stress protein Ctc [Alphaproteobacteria bacterium]|nr:50S ribosomal protein L25/general stress protein Ctc [Alphaproteobacteria bacterium]